jgi:ABC-type uncharacterized transport system involved in gliding motility auxiliary subunit
MRRSSALYGILGLVLLVFGLVDYFIATGFRIFVLINLVGGLFLVLTWMLSSYSELAAIAGSRSTRYGANALVYSLGFIGLLVAVNYLSSLHHVRLDLTEQKVYSLSTQSIGVVRNLKQPLKLYGFFEGGENGGARNLFSTYAYASPKVSFELVDPDKHPELAERFKVTRMGTTHIQYGATDQGINISELTEEALTNGIVRATQTGKKVIEFLDGHGEADPDDKESASGYGTLRAGLEGEGYEVRKLLLAQQPKVPDDVNVLVVAGPTKTLLPHEVEQLNEFLKRGGRMIASFRPQQVDNPIDEAALIKLAGDWGVKVDDDIVVDQVVRLYSGPALGLNPIVQTYGEHPITRGFTQKTVFPMARSIAAMPSLKPGLTVEAIAKTSDTSWGETDVAALFRRQEAKLDDKDIRGPLALAAAMDANLAKLSGGKGEARMVAFGSTDFVNNQNIGTFFNRDFFINSADWLTGEESGISIRPRSLRASRFRLTVDQFSIVFALSVLLLPELLLIIGIWVWWERRN